MKKNSTLSLDKQSHKLRLKSNTNTNVWFFSAVRKSCHFSCYYHMSYWICEKTINTILNWTEYFVVYVKITINIENWKIFPRMWSRYLNFFGLKNAEMHQKGLLVSSLWFQNSVKNKNFFLSHIWDALQKAEKSLCSGNTLSRFVSIFLEVYAS